MEQLRFLTPENIEQIRIDFGTPTFVANSFLQKLLNDGAVERIGGFSGHHIYKSVSGK